jgi:hypothetical protein
LADRSRTLAWVLALVLPFQALTAVYLDVRGPAHHHHHPHDHSVVAIHDHGVPGSPALEEEGRSGWWSATMLVALTANDGSLQLLQPSNGVAPIQSPRFKTRFPMGLERPPRIEQV